MRLIDADKIRFFDCLANLGNGSVCCHTEGITSKLGIEMQPTVEAIPIEWIKKFIDNDILSETVKILLNAWYWEKENEISVMPISDNSTIPLDYLEKENETNR